MGLILDLQNPNNWESRWVLDVQALNQQFQTNGSPLAWEPIPEQDCPLLLDNPFVAVYCESVTKRDSWRFGGYLIQKFSTGLTVGGSLNAVTSNGRKVFFDNLQLLELNGYAENYALTFKPPFWHRDIKLTVWEYVGAITSDERLAIAAGNAQNAQGFAGVQTQLTVIEGKIDSLM